MQNVFLTATDLPLRLNFDFFYQMITLAQVEGYYNFIKFKLLFIRLKNFPTWSLSFPSEIGRYQPKEDCMI